MRVPVLDTTKKTLAPTTPRRARLLLKSGKAAVFRRYPFTIILKREIENSTTPELKIKIDPGSKATGVVIVNQESGEVIFAAEIEHRGHAIKASLDARRSLRRGRRQRKTRYRKPRFNNRRRPEGSLPPSLESRVENVYTWARRLGRAYPKAHWIDAACVGRSTPENLKIENVQPLQIRSVGHGSRQMCRTDKHGFPKAHRTRNTSFMGFETGDIVRADIPKGKFAGRHVGRLSAVRQRPSFGLNGFDVHPKYLKRIHRGDGFSYQMKTVG